MRGQAHQPFDVYRNGKLIDTVFWVKSATVDEVRRSLIEHDGYPSDITVRKVRTKKSNLQGGLGMKFFDLKRIPKRRKGKGRKANVMKRLNALRRKGKKIAKRAGIKPYYFSKERQPKRRGIFQRVGENLEPIIIKEGSLMARRKRSRKSRKVSGEFGRRRSRRSRRTYRGEFGRRRSRRRFSGAVGGKLNPVGIVMEIVGLGAGAAAGSFAAKVVPASVNPKIKTLVPLALGIILPMLKFGKNPFMRNVATGSLAVGTIALIKAFIPQIPMLAGAQNAEDIIQAISELPSEEQAVLGITVETQGEEVLQGAGEGSSTFLSPENM